jgi:xanthine dehydrogenase accessory factor
MRQATTVVLRGGGDIGSGVAHRLYMSGMSVVIAEIEKPTMLRRPVSFAEAIYEGSHRLEGVVARRAANIREVSEILSRMEIPVMVDPEANLVKEIKVDVLVDAIMAKKNSGTSIHAAPKVIGLGPGFKVGSDVHAAIETNRGHDLGRVLLHGEAEPDTGKPGEIGGYTSERVLRAPCPGEFKALKRIGDHVSSGERLAYVGHHAVVSQITGVLRGCVHNGLEVRASQKVGDVDPRDVREYCFTISDKARAIAGGVLEAILYLQNRNTTDKLSP